jgi:hypothetical protein
MFPHPSIGESLGVLAEVAGIPLGGLDDDQLDIVALRLVVECDDERVLNRIGHIVDQVRLSENSAERRAERRWLARRELVGSHDAEEARTELFLVPRRPELRHPSQASRMNEGPIG